MPLITRHPWPSLPRHADGRAVRDNLLKQVVLEVDIDPLFASELPDTRLGNVLAVLCTTGDLFNIKCVRAALRCFVFLRDGLQGRDCPLLLAAVKAMIFNGAS